MIQILAPVFLTLLLLLGCQSSANKKLDLIKTKPIQDDVDTIVAHNFLTPVPTKDTDEVVLAKKIDIPELTSLEGKSDIEVMRFLGKPHLFHHSNISKVFGSDLN